MMPPSLQSPPWHEPHNTVSNFRELVLKHLSDPVCGLLSFLCHMFKRISDIVGYITNCLVELLSNMVVTVSKPLCCV